MTITLKLIIVWACLFLVSFISTVSFAQPHQVVASSGEFLKGDTRQVSFTVGESVVETYQEQQMLFTQGFHQPLLWVTAIEEIEGIDFQIKAFPNPVTDLVKLTVNKELPMGSSYQLYDMHGGLISKNAIERLTTEVSFLQLVPASYFLKVVSEDKTLKTFKIIKK